MIQVSKKNNASIHTESISLGVIFNKKVFGFIVIVTIVLLLSSLMSQTVMAEKISTRKKTVVSVLIQPGDTLWSIASKYYTDEYESLTTYIEEIKKSNGLYTEDIHAGKYIIVPHYVEKAKR